MTKIKYLSKLKCFRIAIINLFALFFILPANASTLEKIRERGYLICGTNQSISGFSQQNENGLWSGFDVDICRAISAAIFLDPSKVEFLPLAGNARFSPLQTGEVDVMARNAAWTMKRDTSYGVRYVATSFFDGQSFLIKQSLGVVSVYQLENISVCVLAGSDDQKNMREFFFQNQIDYQEVPYEEREDLSAAYNAELCDAVSAPASYLYAMIRDLPEPSLNRILPERISKRPLGLVVRAGDDQWANIVRWVFFTLVNAEELGVSSLSVETINDIRTPAIRRLLGLEGDFSTALGLDPEWAQKTIAAVGNYGEIYERNFGPQNGVSLSRGSNA
ncbi:MAG: amino acid ABC transporter substrate-binding protein, partial [Devosiaceae bacterium]|nr:amino acid ABC transporter substrate-binding protein [Devosiaceae bacterium]